MKTQHTFAAALLLSGTPLAALPLGVHPVGGDSRGGITDPLSGRRMGVRTPDRFSTDGRLFNMDGPTDLPLQTGDVLESGCMGDFNHDGSGDVVVVVKASGQASNLRTMAAFFGNSTGYSAGPRAAFSTATYLHETPLLRPMDMDHDGDLDIVYAVGRTNTVHEISVFTNWALNTGRFDTATSVMAPATAGSGGTRVMDIVPLRFNLDLWPDIMVSDGENDRILCYTGSSTGTFTLSAAIVTEDTPNRIWGMDMDSDGRTDLVSASGETYLGGGQYATPATRRLVWRRNTGLGWGTPSFLDSTTTLDAEYGGATLVDLDDDGTRDFVFYRSSDILNDGRFDFNTHLFWRRGIKGQPGSFIGAQDLENYYSYSQVRGLSASDFDSDGDEDLLFAVRRSITTDGGVYDGIASRVDNRVHGESTAVVADQAGAVPSGAAKLAVGDVNGDTWPDLIASSPGGRAILWYAGRATGGFAAPVSIGTGTAVPSCVDAGDFDADGETDLVWAIPASGEIRRALNSNGSGTSWSQLIVATLPGLTWLSAANANGDLDTDLLAVASGGTVAWLYNNPAAGTWTQDTLPALPGAVRAIAAKFMPNVRPEVASITNAPGSMEVRYNFILGSPPWQLVRTESGGGAGSSAGVTSGDFNRDGWQDCAWCAGSNTIKWVTPGISASAATTVGTASSPVNTLRSLDWNRDGFADILCAHSTGLSIWISRPDQTEKWEQLVLLSSGAITDAVPIHIDHDALMDVAAFDSTTGRLKLITHSPEAQVIVSDEPMDPDTALRAGNAETPYALVLESRHNGRAEHQTYTSSYTGGAENDAPAIPDRFRIRFVKAVQVGGEWVPGTSLTQAEISASVDKVLVVKESSPVSNPTIGINDTILLETPVSVNSGYQTLTMPAGADYDEAHPEASNGIKYHIALRLKPVVSAALTGPFFVQQAPTDPAQGTRFVTSEGAPARQPLYTVAAAPTSGQLFRLYTAYENWRYSWYQTYGTSGNAANSADMDRDGMDNIAEYILGKNPGVADATPALSIQPSGSVMVLYADLPPVAREDGIVTLQESSSLTAWTTYATRTGSAAWTGAPHSTIFYNGVSRTTFAPPSAGRKFYRLNFTLLP